MTGCSAERSHDAGNSDGTQRGGSGGFADFPGTSERHAYKAVIVGDWNKVTLAWVLLDCLIIHIITHLIVYLRSTTFRMCTPAVMATANIMVVTWLNARMSDFLNGELSAAEEWSSEPVGPLNPAFIHVKVSASIFTLFSVFLPQFKSMFIFFQ